MQKNFDDYQTLKVFTDNHAHAHSLRLISASKYHNSTDWNKLNDCDNFRNLYIQNLDVLDLFGCVVLVFYLVFFNDECAILVFTFFVVRIVMKIIYMYV